tara:strand:- start:49 stop:477 length:429 start_codon:yes stop_codon:yes gene_type:complete
MHKFLIFCILIFPKFVFSQLELSWNDLEDVEFSDLYVDEMDDYVLWPHFGSNVRQLDGKEVKITGYVLAIDIDKKYYVLSKGPFASCFFCGVGGPESVLELSLKSDKDVFVMDQFLTMKGVLRLNAEDIYRCVYILENAEVY